MSALRDRFIEDIAHGRFDGVLDLRTSNAKGQEGRFIDKRTHQIWLGYQLAHEVGFYKDKVVEDDSRLLGTYVIGNHIGPGVKLRMANLPYVNKTKALAYAEAERLTELFGGPFAVFRCVKTFSREVSDATLCSETQSD